MTDKRPRSEDNDAFDGGTSPLKSDLQSAKDFLVDITRRWPEVCEGAQLEVTGILKVDEKTKQVRPALYPPTEQGIAAALNRAAALNNQGFNIYFAPNPVAPHVRLNPGKRPKDIDIAGAVYAFADGDDDVGSYALLEETLSTLVVRTGSVPGPRVHAYWELIEPIKFNGSEREPLHADGASH